MIGFNYLRRTRRIYEDIRKNEMVNRTKSMFIDLLVIWVVPFLLIPYLSIPPPTFANIILGTIFIEIIIPIVIITLHRTYLRKREFQI